MQGCGIRKIVCQIHEISYSFAKMQSKYGEFQLKITCKSVNFVVISGVIFVICCKSIWIFMAKMRKH